MFMPSGGQYIYYYTVGDVKSASLKDMLTNHHDYSSRLLRQIKRDGNITRNGKDCWLTDPVLKGDEVVVTFPLEKYDIMPVKGSVNIVYEDDEVLVVNKEANCVTHPTKSHQEDTLANFVAHYWEERGTPGKIRFVNRLDRDTTGLVVIAKNKYVHHYIQSRMKTEQVKKTYVAFVNNVPKEEAGCIRASIGRPSEESLIRTVMKGGKESVTHYRVLENYRNAAMVELVLETGRTHQIRVHLQYIGCPIIGDSLYNTDQNPNYGIGRQALHAAKLNLTLPKTGELELSAELTEDLMKLRDVLRKE